jgi:hypothetical protein
METSIKIKRNRKYVDSLRSYKIILDCEEVGIIFQDKSISIAMQPGQHSLRMKLEQCSSEEINFDIELGEEIRFECENNRSSPLELLLYVYYSFFEKDRWILLKQCE